MNCAGRVSYTTTTTSLIQQIKCFSQEQMTRKKFIVQALSICFVYLLYKTAKVDVNDTVVSSVINIHENKQFSTYICRVKYLHLVHKGLSWPADVYTTFVKLRCQALRSNITFFLNRATYIYKCSDQTFIRSLTS